nr:salicylic acid methyltransferase [Oenothera biennis]
MGVSQVLHMNGGAGENSYGNNSLLQRKVISMTKPITEEAITALYSGSLGTMTRLAIADLGCSSGPNTLFAVTELIEAVDKLCKKKGQTPPEYQIFLNDLPGNDFNTIFRSLPNIQGSCFFTGVPGSFYGRLFPRNTIHFVHSSYSLMWLSQVPQGIEGNNNRNIYMASTSPQKVLDAYYNQFKNDFGMFLKCREQELVPGGRMVLTILGRRSEDRASNECCCIWELLAMALNEMVFEGLIAEEKMNSFNIPQYTPSPSEVKAEVLKEGSFSIDHLEASEVSWSGRTNNGDYDQLINGSGREESYSVARCMRAVAEPILRDHFGDDEDIIEDVFRRYKLLIINYMDKNKTKFINVVVSLVRRSDRSEKES